MTKVAFLQYMWVEFLGTMYLSAALKKSGHDCRAFIGRQREIIKGIRSFKPDIVAFSIFTGQHRWAVNLAKDIKESLGKEKFIIMGGAHPTFYPDLIKDEYVDAICIGEGEGAMVEVADAFEEKGGLEGIGNLWFKRGSEIIKNPLRPLIQDLDSLPFADREVYYRYNFLRTFPNKHFIAGRGCPYNCTFCFNNSLKEMYCGISKDYVRLRSPQKVIEEIEEVKLRYPLPTLRFIDDTFIQNKEWLLSLLRLYKERFDIPFYCNVRANLVDEDIVSALKEANCYRVSFGVESGNEAIRNKILAKGVTDDQIKYTAILLRKHDIEFDTTNMLGLPGESLSNAWETVEMNIDIKPTAPWTSIFQPYPGTQISSYILEKGLMDNIDVEGITGDAHTSSPLNQPDIKRIENLHKFVYLVVRFPFLKPLVNLLIRLPPNRVFKLIYKISYFIFFYSKAKRLNPIRILNEILKAIWY